MYFFPLLFIIIGFGLNCLTVLYYTMEIDSSLGVVKLCARKNFCCFATKHTIEFKDIQQVIVQTDNTSHYYINGVHYFTFEVIFKLINGNEIKGCKGIIDKDGEANKVIQILRRALPQNLHIIEDLAH